MLGGLAGKELTKQVQRSGEEAQTVEDHGLHRLPEANVFLGMGAKLLVDLFDQTDLIYDARDYAQVIDVLNFYAWSLPRFIHGSIKYLSSYSHLRNAGNEGLRGGKRSAGVLFLAGFMHKNVPLGRPLAIYQTVSEGAFSESTM